MDDMPTRPPAPPMSPTPPPPPGNGDDTEPLPQQQREPRDIAEEKTGLLAGPQSRRTLLEDQARQHDQEVERLTAWRDHQVRRWMSVAWPQLRSAERHMDDLRMAAAVRPLTEAEKRWR